MKKRVLSVLLITALLLGIFAVGASAAPVTAVIELPQPADTDFRFNGHWVNDRESFDLNISDWSLGTFSDQAAVITAGATTGYGISYRKALKENWYACVSISMTDSDEAGLQLSADSGSVLVLLRSADDKLTLAVEQDGNILLEKTVSDFAGKASVILDHSASGKLGLYLSGEAYLGGWEISSLPESATQVLCAVTSMDFYATKEATIFSDFGVNNMLYKYANDPAKALALVESWAQSEVQGSIVYADNGVPMYTPDGVKNYDALWTRDFTYQLVYAGDYIPTENAIACIEYLLENVHEGDCWMPDRVYGNGKVNYAAGDMDYSRRNLDNNSFIIIALDVVLSRLSPEEGKALLEKWQSVLMTGLDSLPKDEKGLIYNDPLNPHSPYGFTDCIAKTGSLMKESLLLWQAYGIMAKWQDAYGMDSSVAAAGAQLIEAALVETFQNEDGMLDAATVDCDQTDVWGSCYAVSIGFPMEESLKKSIADYIAANYTGLVQMGQLRHTEPGTYWERLLSGVNEGDYQNGAYWATPTGWLLDTLEPYYPELAIATLQDVITYFEEVGIYEWVNGSTKKLNHYAASASNILPAARRMLTETVPVEDVAIAGDTKIAKGATKLFTLTVNPENANIASYSWMLDDAEVSKDATLSYTFLENGTYVLECTVKDVHGNSKTANVTLTVTTPEYAPITVTADAVYGAKGQEVTVKYQISKDSDLSAAEIVLNYDPKILEPIAVDGNYVVGGSIFDGVLASSKTEDGKIAIALAAKPVTDSGVLFTVQFRLLADCNTAVYAQPVFQLAAADHKDDTGVQPTQIQVEYAPAEDVPPTGEVVLLSVALLMIASVCGMILVKKKFLF